MFVSCDECKNYNIYLNDSLLEDVFTATTNISEVYLFEHDNVGEVYLFEHDSAGNRVPWYDRMKCAGNWSLISVKGHVRIEPKVKTEEPVEYLVAAAEWFQRPLSSNMSVQGLIYNCIPDTNIYLKMVGSGTSDTPFFEVPQFGRDGIDTKWYMSRAEDALKSTENILVCLKPINHLQPSRLEAVILYVINPLLTTHLNSFSSPNRSIIDNIDTKTVDIELASCFFSNGKRAHVVNTLQKLCWMP